MRCKRCGHSDGWHVGPEFWVPMYNRQRNPVGWRRIPEPYARCMLPGCSCSLFTASIISPRPAS